MQVPTSRVRALNSAPVSPNGRYVLYWMTAARRPRFNFALQHAVEHARKLNLPLVVLEALRVGYRWASARLHRFVIEGMAANAAYFEGTTAQYYPYVEPSAGAGSGLLEAFAKHAYVVVTDDYPAFFLPRMAQAAARKLAVRLDAVDSNGLLPIALAGGRPFHSAYSFRRFLQQKLSAELSHLPVREPLANLKLPRLQRLSAELQLRWPALTARQLAESDELIAKLPIDQDVKPVADVEGGWIAGQWVMTRFLERRLDQYAGGRNHPDAMATSGLSPWLHFGHVSTHDVICALKDVEGWDGVPRGDKRDGSREGFWGLSVGAEAFLDELVTWRELGFNACATMPEYDRYESLPAWSKTTLEAHAKDPREHLYELPQLEAAQTSDPVWNAAQRQLLREGRVHNYLRMLWGKKVLEWSESPQRALDHLIHLNNKYALDGRDPSSYAGIFWVFGRYDRPWSPERPIYGTVRYMSSAAAQRKLRMRQYLERFGSDQLPLSVEA